MGIQEALAVEVFRPVSIHADDGFAAISSGRLPKELTGIAQTLLPVS